jgi:malonyl CoA-acyl carrier protein transacylase
MNQPVPVAIVGLGAILPDAPDVDSFWKNIQAGRYSITDVPAERWNPDLFYSPDITAIDKTYSKVGGWVRGFSLSPLKMGLSIPPRILEQIDQAQQWAIAASYQALQDYGYPARPLNPERVAVILGNAMAGEKHYRTTMRIYLPEYLDILASLPAYQSLAPELQKVLADGFTAGIRGRIPAVNEDTMPGELGNIIAGRVANAFNFSGANFVTDAACASSLAALESAVNGLRYEQYDAVLTGGVDRNMGPESFVKFSKIGALSPDGSRPYAEGANGFVMGEGTAIFLLKRLVDAERDGDKVYAVIRGIGGSSDGRGKGITAPNPLGQRRAIERAWKNAGVSPASAGLIEGHGTSTPVGDLAETGALNDIFGQFDLRPGTIALGSVKSNFGHLKSAAGAAGLLKSMLALYNHTLPPSVNFQKPNPKIDFAHLPFAVNTQVRPWDVKHGEIRRAGVSAFGFGGTNFHIVLEEYLPEVLLGEKQFFPGVEIRTAAAEVQVEPEPALSAAGKDPQPYRGMLFLGEETTAGLRDALSACLQKLQAGQAPESRCPSPAQIRRPERLVFDYSDSQVLMKNMDKALKALETDSAADWQALGMHGVYRGRGAPGKVAFLFPGQGSQYVNMLRDLYDIEPVVKATFNEADRVMTPLMGRSLSSYIFADGGEEALKQAETDLRNTTITQPAILIVNVALLRLLAKYGFQPDLVAGHSLGEYAALVAAEVLSLAEALEVVSARGREMSRISVGDNGCMAAVSAPLTEVERILKTIDGYVVIANMNSPLQSVIGGETPAVEAAIAAFLAADFQAAKIPVSHAFHTKIVAPASQPLREIIGGMHIRAPRIPIVANVTGKLYPSGRQEIIDMLAAQVASPVQFIQDVQTMYEQGARVFVEVGPKRVLSGLATDILKGRSDIQVLSTNHPRKGGMLSAQEALCRLYAAGVTNVPSESEARPLPVDLSASLPVDVAPAAQRQPVTLHGMITGSVVISGAGLGLPGRGRHVFDDANIESALNGEMRIDALPLEVRQAMLEKRVTRLVKSESGADMRLIDELDQTIKLAGQRGEFDLVEEFGFPTERMEAIDVSTQLAIAAGIEALRDAGIPLVKTYKRTSTGSLLADRWRLPEALADETGVIFASAFPGLDQMAHEADGFYRYQSLQNQIQELQKMADLVPSSQTDLRASFDQRLQELRSELAVCDYHFDRRFIFRVLSMGHSQFAEYIGARGPNTHINAACASTTQALSIAEDWVRSGRARRVVVIAGDDVSSGSLSGWIGTSLMASGAATTEGDLRKAVLPFDRRRNGMIIGMGAAALVVESEDAVRERGMHAICEILGSYFVNSAFHGTRLDVGHVSRSMEQLVRLVEERFGLSRRQFAEEMVFMSHETYTPARGGSASAEIHALRNTFGDQAGRVVIANTKGMTGHTMGVGIEDVVAVKSLQFGRVPPIANIADGFEADPELGDLNLSRGGQLPVRFALRLGAGFGSQIAMVLLRKVAGQGERVDRPVYQGWLDKVSGYPQAELVTVKRTLQIVDQGAPKNQPAASSWQYGQVPAMRAIPADPAGSSQPAPIAAPRAVVQKATLPAADFDQIKTFVVQLVSEKTGYPPELLDLDLDLEADLGVDTVKQAELLASIRAQYGIPRREDLRLSDYNTLAKVIAFVQTSLANPALERLAVEARIEANAPAAAPHKPTIPTLPAASPVMGTIPASPEIQAFVLNLVSEKTGYPVEVLDPNLDLEADLGVDTVKQAELMSAIRTRYEIPRREDLRLSDFNTLAKVYAYVQDSLRGLPALAAVPVAASVTASPVETTPVTSPEPVAETATIPVEEIQAFVQGQVSEKTGYPVEVLELDLDLEADLGIDTVKQAELLAAIRERYGFVRREDLRLSDFNTLAKVIAYVQDSLLEKAQPQPLLEVESSVDEEVVEALNTVSARPVRRVPLPTLLSRLNLCPSSGVDLGAGKRVIVATGNGKEGEALIRKLRSRSVEALRLTAGLAQAQMEAKLAGWLSEGPVEGVFFLTGLDVEPPLSELTYEEWQLGLENRLYALYRLMRSLPETTFLVSATRLGGLHGLDRRGASAPLGGAVSGFTKALARERPEVFHKVVDFEATATPAVIASALLEEALADPASLEVGRKDDLRYGIASVERPLSGGSTAPLAPGSVFLVSGGSAGILPPILSDLARATQGKFYLLGRSPLPAQDDLDVLRLMSDRPGLRKDLTARMSADGTKVRPLQVEKAMEALDRAAAVHQTLGKIAESGGQGVYICCDVTDPKAVTGAVKQVLTAEGRVDVLLHAAGMEQSRKLEKKTPDEFRQVVSAKADGFYQLFKALEKRKKLPGAVVFFGSVSGRYGNSGQTDYSAANDLLARLASAFRNQYPKVRAIAIDWGAWAEIGMASRGNTSALMKMAGVDLLPPEQAAAWVREELQAGQSGEVIRAGSLGTLSGPRASHAGVDLALADRALREGNPAHTMLSHVTGFDPERGLFLEADLDPVTLPYLKDHAVDGTPYLPGVMGIEGFSIAARHIGSILASARGDLEVSRLEAIQFLAALKFYRNEPRHITWLAHALWEEDELVVYVTLESTRAMQSGRNRHILHFSGKVHLEPHPTLQKEVMLVAPKWNGKRTVTAEDIYRLYFHGPSFQVLEGVQRSRDGLLGKLNKGLPGFGAKQTPLSRAMLVELCFQTAGVWEIGKTGSLCLPHSIESLFFHRDSVNGLPVYARVRPMPDGEGGVKFDAEVVDAEGRLYLELKNYRTVSVPLSAKQEFLEPMKLLVQEP